MSRGKSMDLLRLKNGLECCCDEGVDVGANRNLERADVDISDILLPIVHTLNRYLKALRPLATRPSSRVAFFVFRRS